MQRISATDARIVYRRHERGVNTRDWLGVITKGADGDFQLWLGYAKEGESLDERLSPAGTFKTGNAAVKYVRSIAAKKFDNDSWMVLADTLDTLRNRTASSLVPRCYGDASYYAREKDGKCMPCPYRTTCGTSPDPLPKEEPQEDDSAFVTRLQAKIKAKFGGQR